VSRDTWIRWQYDRLLTQRQNGEISHRLTNQQLFEMATEHVLEMEDDARQDPDIEIVHDEEIETDVFDLSDIE
jgi:hypothetical protein